MRLNYCFKETFYLLATRAGGFKQELSGIDQELTEIFFLFKQQLPFFKQQLPAIEQQLSAIRSLASRKKIYKIYKISLACEREVI